ncbi:membrane protein [Desulfolithobacter dissulfuricans]|uniref:Membrane protein n=1 Tax=Desulfolithobacter dissulfuricans TaxID=2795293 RepID=A0A915U717_9BACT|nr:efflux transporter outer membrane subunit [Desulfolithobacter dissulfuricans]BCO10792.1 membrane protein [Desulfolithobacter dissulfuricans]
MPVFRPISLIFLCLILTTGCQDRRPVPLEPLIESLPEHFSRSGGNHPPGSPWWTDFKSPELARFIQAGLAENLDLQGAWARLNQAKALAKAAQSPLYPELQASAGAARNQGRDQTGDTWTSDSFSLGLTAGYEVDLWGRVRADVARGRLDIQAGRAEMDAMALSLSGRIGELWIDLLAVLQQEELFERQLNVNRQLLEATRLRFAAGQASARDIFLQSRNIRSVAGAQIALQGRKELLQSQLALLMGQPPGNKPELEQKQFPDTPPIPDPGLPADLLSRRPDVRAAALRLQSASLSNVAARAERLPQLRLNTSLNLNSQAIHALLDSWLLNLAADLTAPLFDGSRRQAEVERTRALIDEQLAAYRGTVLKAIREVEDALSREHELNQTVLNLEAQIQLSDMTGKETVWRYLNGREDVLSVLRAQTDTLNLSRELIKVRADLLKTRITLYKALGGTWTDSLNDRTGRN